MDIDNGDSVVVDITSFGPGQSTTQLGTGPVEGQPNFGKVIFTGEDGDGNPISTDYFPISVSGQVVAFPQDFNRARNSQVTFYARPSVNAVVKVYARLNRSPVDTEIVNG